MLYAKNAENYALMSQRNGTSGLLDRSNVAYESDVGPASWIGEHSFDDGGLTVPRTAGHEDQAARGVEDAQQFAMHSMGSYASGAPDIPGTNCQVDSRRVSTAGLRGRRGAGHLLVIGARRELGRFREKVLDAIFGEIVIPRRRCA
jgi:hypothetical protein